MAFPVLCRAAFGRPEVLLIGGMRTGVMLIRRNPATHWGALSDEGNSIDLQIDRLDDG
jgi:hypothetical protein